MGKSSSGDLFPPILLHYLLYILCTFSTVVSRSNEIQKIFTVFRFSRDYAVLLKFKYISLLTTFCLFCTNFFTTFVLLFVCYELLFVCFVITKKIVDYHFVPILFKICKDKRRRGRVVYIFLKLYFNGKDIHFYLFAESKIHSKTIFSNTLAFLMDSR